MIFKKIVAQMTVSIFCCQKCKFLIPDHIQETEMGDSMLDIMHSCCFSVCFVHVNVHCNAGVLTL